MLWISLLALSCGGGSSNNSSPPPPIANTQGIVVNSGPAGGTVNGAFTTVAICSPGAQTCQSIDGILVDTGSYGLRILSSAISSSLTLPQQTNSGGQAVATCAEFADSLTWGPVKSADVQLAQLKANSVPIQVIGDPNYPDTTVPLNCSSSGLPPNDTLSTLGANGILGVGVFTDDCGPACATTGSNPGVYYACSTPSSCVVTAEPEASQLQNPVWLLSSDNNGLSITLPSVPDVGSLTVSGTLTFGIGTQSNNGLAGATVFPVDPSSGNFITAYKSTQYPNSFIDSGSGAIFFLDTVTTGIPECSGTGPNAGLYCPSGTVNQTAINFGANGSPSNVVSFSIANADSILCNTCTSSALSDLGGAGTTLQCSTNSTNLQCFVDWGLPFFYGRTVFVAIDGQATPAGTGPYWAY